MIKLVALFKQPDDPDGFMRHYREVHEPLVKKTPGLVRYEVSRVTADPFGGEPAYFLVAEMYYPDRDTFRTAMRSPENQAVGKDAISFARGLLTALVCEVDE